ncbi:MAG: hypothetical protein JXK05_13900 [Campylobacterales bacterium]|nr:hypothetical protein [Campylobacterales bacterium]
MASALDRLKDLTSKISSYELTRKENYKRLERLFEELGIGEKVEPFEAIFDFKAINLTGVSLTPEGLGSIHEGRYVQMIAISYDAQAVVKNRNRSLGYFGRAEKIDPKRKAEVVSFVLSWRFEKSFRTLEHYNALLDAHLQEA